VSELFNTLDGKIITVFGFAFKADTSDTRESPAIDICKTLIAEGARLHVAHPPLFRHLCTLLTPYPQIYDPQVSREQIRADLGDAFAGVTVFDEPYRSARSAILLPLRSDARFRSACIESHALIIVTEWKEFAQFDYSRIYATMTHPSHIWDGRNLLPLQTMTDMGFIVHSIGRRA
jgi:UDPglucose 6-dehydrogenase